MTAPTLTAGELRVLQLSIYCYETQPKVDYKKLMEVGSYKTVASAQTVYLAARKKLLAAVADGGVTTGTPTTTPSKKRGKVAADGDDDEGAPSAKKRGRKPKAKAVEVAADGVDEDGTIKDEDVKQDVDETFDAVKQKPDEGDIDELA